MKNYLIVADASASPYIKRFADSLKGVAPNRCAWLIEWSETVSALRSRIRSLLPTHHTRVVISEVTGDCETV